MIIGKHGCTILYLRVMNQQSHEHVLHVDVCTDCVENQSSITRKSFMSYQTLVVTGKSLPGKEVSATQNDTDADNEWCEKGGDDEANHFRFWWIRCLQVIQHNITPYDDRGNHVSNKVIWSLTHNGHNDVISRKKGRP